MELSANILAVRIEGDLIWLLVVAAIAIIAKIARVIKESAEHARQEQERIRRQQEGGGPAIPPTRERMSGMQQQMPPRIRRRQMHQVPGAEASLPQGRPSPSEIGEAIRHGIPREAQRQRYRQIRAEASGAGEPIRRTPPPVPRPAAGRSVAIEAEEREARVEEELALQRRRMEQQEAACRRRMAAKTPSEADTAAIEARLVHIRKGQAAAKAGEPGVLVNLMQPGNMRQAILFHEILSPPKALREEADLPALR